MEPIVGILTLSEDIHGYAIKKKIEDRHGTRCCLIPGNELAKTGELTWSAQHATPPLVPTTDGEAVDVRSLGALWYRRVCTTQNLPEAADPEFAPHIDYGCETALRGLLLTEFRGRWVSHPMATQLAENKLVQLRAARQAGLRIPATLVSQVPAQIRAFCAAHPGAIIKPIGARRGQELAATAIASPELLENDEVLALVPAIYQECVRGERHLRISVVGERCDAALIEAQELDWRMDLNVPFTPYSLDRRLRERLRATLHHLGLAMGIFDMKITDQDEPVFLEVNPQGQFLFVEGLCGIPLADALADFLVEQAMEDGRARGSHRAAAALP